MVVHSFAHMYLTSLYLTFLKFYQVLPLHMHSRSQGVEPSNIACDAGAAGPAEATVHWSGLSVQLTYPSANVCVYAEAGGGGLGACSTSEFFVLIWCCEMASEAIFGPKTPPLIFGLVLTW